MADWGAKDVFDIVSGTAVGFSKRGSDIVVEGESLSGLAYKIPLREKKNCSDSVYQLDIHVAAAIFEAIIVWSGGASRSVKDNSVFIILATKLFVIKPLTYPNKRCLKFEVL